MTWFGLRGQKDAPARAAPPHRKGARCYPSAPQRLLFPVAALRDVDSPWITRTVGVRVPTINWKTRLGIVFPWEFGRHVPREGLDHGGPLCWRGA